MKTFAVAANTFREARRDRAHWILILYTVVLLGGAFVLSPLALGEGYRVTRDLGLGAMSLVGVLLIVLVGSGMVQKEVERRTILTVLAKPIHRYEFLTGKFLGLLAMVAMIFAGMTGLLAALLFLREGRVDPAVLMAAFFTFFELAVMTAVVVGFSTFVSPALTGIFTITMFLMGHFAGDLLLFAERMGSKMVSWPAWSVYLMLPHLDTFNLRAEAAYGVLPPGEQVVRTVLYGVLYCVSLLAMGCVVFTRREFR